MENRKIPLPRLDFFVPLVVFFSGSFEKIEFAVFVEFAVVPLVSLVNEL